MVRQPMKRIECRGWQQRVVKEAQEDGLVQGQGGCPLKLNGLGSCRGGGPQEYVQVGGRHCLSCDFRRLPAGPDDILLGMSREPQPGKSGLQLFRDSGVFLSMTEESGRCSLP